jgi:hypothetical protein
MGRDTEGFHDRVVASGQKETIAPRQPFGGGDAREG